MRWHWLTLGCVAGLAASPLWAADDLGPKLSPPVQVLAEGKAISVDVGHAAPCLADIDGDGKWELLVGQFGEGKLRIYPNQGTAKDPKFGPFTWFQAGGEVGKVPTG